MASPPTRRSVIERRLGGEAAAPELARVCKRGGRLGLVSGYGPTKTLAAILDPVRREQLKRDFIEFHERYRTDLGIAMPREYLVTIGYRR
jgi:hypothetical protein